MLYLKTGVSLGLGAFGASLLLTKIDTDRAFVDFVSHTEGLQNKLGGGREDMKDSECLPIK